MAKSTYQTSKLLGIDVFSSGMDELLKDLGSRLKLEKPLVTLMTPNPEQVVLSRKDQTFLDHLRSSDMLLPDGIGLVIASRILHPDDETHWIRERISGREVAEALLAVAQTEKLSVLVVGGKNYLNSKELTKGELSTINGKQHSGVYWTQGYKFIDNPTGAEEEEVTSLIKKLKPEIVFVAFGAPQQEAWLIEHQALLKETNVRIAMVVGGAFDVLLGKISPAPDWMQRSGLEWLYRLFQEPWRWRRQLKLLSFVKLVVQEWLFTK